MPDNTCILSLHCKHTTRDVAGFADDYIDFEYGGNPFSATAAGTWDTLIDQLDTLITEMNTAVGAAVFSWTHDEDWYIRIISSGDTWEPTFTTARKYLWEYLGFPEVYTYGAQAYHTGLFRPRPVIAIDGWEKSSYGLVGALQGNTSLTGESAAAGFGYRNTDLLQCDMIPREKYREWTTWWGFLSVPETSQRAVTFVVSDHTLGSFAPVDTVGSDYVIAPEAALTPQWVYQNNFFNLQLPLWVL